MQGDFNGAAYHTLKSYEEHRPKNDKTIIKQNQGVNQSQKQKSTPSSQCNSFLGSVLAHSIFNPFSNTEESSLKTCNSSNAETRALHTPKSTGK